MYKVVNLLNYSINILRVGERINEKKLHDAIILFYLIKNISRKRAVILFPFMKRLQLKLMSNYKYIIVAPA